MIDKDEMKDILGHDDKFLRGLDVLFREHGAKLFIHKPEYAFLQLGKYRFYFHSNVKLEEIETMKGEKITRTIVPYDGWEVKINE